jgi:putative transposase
VSAFIEARKALGFAVALTCRSIGTSPSAHYQRATGELSTRAIEDERLLSQIRRVYRANYEAYGSLRVWKALKREGIDVGRGRVERLMSTDGLSAPSAAAGRGRPPSPTPPAQGAPTSSTATSARRVPMLFGSPTSRI